MTLHHAAGIRDSKNAKFFGSPTATELLSQSPPRTPEGLAGRFTGENPELLALYMAGDHAAYIQWFLDHDLPEIAAALTLEMLRGG